MTEPNAVRPVPQQRIREKVDECMSRKDYAGVERVLLYWLEEAQSGGDLRGKLMILNELVGHYRKTHESEKIRQRADEALRLVNLLGYEDAISGATTYVNIATAYNSLGEDEPAVPLFEHARQIYESHPGTDAPLLGGLYNNMGLTYTALKQYNDALAVYRLALTVMGQVPGGETDQAITCLNMADTLSAMRGLEAEQDIYPLLDQAESYLNAPGLPRDSYYAYVCEHCAPTFEYFGYFAAAETLRQRAEAIYERS